MTPTPIPVVELPPDTHASQATLYVSAQTSIRASAPHVYGILTDLAGYPEWNSFIRAAEVTSTASTTTVSDALEKEQDKSGRGLNVGDKVLLHVVMKVEKPLTDARVVVREVSHLTSTTSALQAEDGKATQEDETYRLAWAGDGFPQFLLSAYRAMEVCAVPKTDSNGAGNVACEFRTWETMTGPLAHVVKALYGTVLQKRFLEMAEDLRRVAERQDQTTEARSGGGDPI